MTVLIHIEMTGQSVVISKRAQRRVNTEAHRAAGKYWDRNYLAMHFTRLAPKRYGYQERTEKTKRRKQQLAARGVVQKGGHVSLVHTGLLERTMTRQHVIRAYPSRVTIPMPATSYTNARPRGNQPNMPREITTVIDSERKKIGEAAQAAHDKFTAKEVKENRYSKRV